MRHILGLLFLSCLLLVSVRAEEEKPVEAVIELTADTFDQVIKENPFVLVEFYVCLFLYFDRIISHPFQAPWCGYCKQLAPDYEKAAQELKGEAVVTKIDGTVEEELADTFAVMGYPTIKFFKYVYPFGTRIPLNACL